MSVMESTQLDTPNGRKKHMNGNSTNGVVYPDLDNNDSEENLKSKSCFSKYTIQLFVLNFGLLQFFQMTASVYWIGVVRTVEKRFGLSSTQSNFVMSINDIVHISIVIFVGYFGRKGHKPRIIGSTAICLVIGSLLMSSPYFIYGEESAGLLLQNETEKTSTTYCSVNKNSTDDCETGEALIKYSRNSNAWYIFLVASAFNGLGGVAMQVLGMAYIDENSEKTKSGFYLGIATSAFSLGPICGIFLAAIATRLPENLKPTDKDPNDPTWIGAWWLGYLLCSILLAIGLFPMFFYPKHIIDPSLRSSKEKKKNYNENSTLLDQIKEFPKLFWKLLNNKAYVCILFTAVFSCYVITGVFMNAPRYIEIHFIQPAFKANLGAAMPGISGVFGGFMGGFIMSKFKFTPPQMAKFMTFSVSVVACGLAVNMFVTCPQVQYAGQWSSDHKSLSPDLSCNSNCSCDAVKHTFHPVCSQAEDLTYFSPCHAGCTEYQSVNETLYHTSCSCVENKEVSDGQCQPPCDREFWTFALVFLVMSLLSSLGRVPGTVLQFRVVDDENGSFALGITSFMVNACAFIPGPIIFGLIIDSTCVLWQQECGQTGSCLIYDTERFRYLIFGFSLMFEVITVIFAVALVFITARMVFTSKENATVTNEIDIKKFDGIHLQEEVVLDRVSSM